ncbi:NUDIX domain protein [Pseudoruegeria aquimaris]|uniref:NUDIX domain protein n=1 Tax=Pseudoruegeria aquimaris TaxID=393663 RepID=A0A1Y5T677_9RHOB|nr:NUDIX domain-containing protein [Pseudoruegeria aquimaris]SLN56831.1 NUDIX domain protein [Pseudoruegeria aquimaris]
MDKSAIRNAATVILVRDGAHGPQVLMGQRGAGAAFMPNKFVFPGGAVDAADAAVPLAGAPPRGCAARLREESDPALVNALYVAAIRELWEETGQILGEPGPWPTPEVPEDWKAYAATGHRPSPEGLHFFFRAITPPGRPRRFDARFFVARAEALRSDPDDFSRASDELSHLHWVPLAEARSYDLPFITEVVLAELTKALRSGRMPETVPFFRNDDEESLFLRLGGRSPLTSTG